MFFSGICLWRIIKCNNDSIIFHFKVDIIFDSEALRLKCVDSKEHTEI